MIIIILKQVQHEKRTKTDLPTIHIADDQGSPVTSQAEDQVGKSLLSFN